MRRRYGSRRVGWWFWATLAGCAFAAVFGLVWLAPRLLERAAESFLGKLPVLTVRVKVGEVSPWFVRVEEVELGDRLGSLSVEDARAEFLPWELLRGEVRSLTVESLRAEIDLAPWFQPGPEGAGDPLSTIPPPESDAPSSWPSLPWPVRYLAVQNGLLSFGLDPVWPAIGFQVLLESGHPAHLSGVISLAGKGIEGQLLADLDPVLGNGLLSGTVLLRDAAGWVQPVLRWLPPTLGTNTLGADSLQIESWLNLDQGRFGRWAVLGGLDQARWSGPGLEVRLAALSLGVQGEGLEVPVGTALLALEGVSGDGWGLGSGEASLRLDRSEVMVEWEAWEWEVQDLAKGMVSFSGSCTLPTAESPLAWSMQVDLPHWEVGGRSWQPARLLGQGDAAGGLLQSPGIAPEGEGMEWFLQDLEVRVGRSPAPEGAWTGYASAVLLARPDGTNTWGWDLEASSASAPGLGLAVDFSGALRGESLEFDHGQTRAHARGVAAANGRWAGDQLEFQFDSEWSEGTMALASGPSLSWAGLEFGLVALPGPLTAWTDALSTPDSGRLSLVDLGRAILPRFHALDLRLASLSAHDLGTLSRLVVEKPDLETSDPALTVRADEAHFQRLDFTGMRFDLVWKPDVLSLEGGLSWGDYEVPLTIQATLDRAGELSFRLSMDQAFRRAWLFSGLVPDLGQVTVDGRVALEVDGLADGTLMAAIGRVVLDGLALADSSAGWKVEGLSGTLDFEDLLLGRTLGFQTIRFSRLQLGDEATLSDGELRIAYDGDGTMVVDHFSCRAFGGSLQIHPFALDLRTREGLVVLILQAIDLAELARVFPQLGIEARGLLDGEIPLRLSAQGVFPTAGRLDLRKGSGGWVRYLGDGWLTAGMDPRSREFRAMQMVERACRDLSLQSLRLVLFDPAVPDVPVYAVVQGTGKPDGQNTVNVNLTVNGRGFDFAQDEPMVRRLIQLLSGLQIQMKAAPQAPAHPLPD